MVCNEETSFCVISRVVGLLANASLDYPVPKSVDGENMLIGMKIGALWATAMSMVGMSWLSLHQAHPWDDIADSMMEKNIACSVMEKNMDGACP